MYSHEPVEVDVPHHISLPVMEPICLAHNNTHIAPKAGYKGVFRARQYTVIVFVMSYIVLIWSAYTLIEHVSLRI